MESKLASQMRRKVGRRNGTVIPSAVNGPRFAQIDHLGSNGMVLDQIDDGPENLVNRGWQSALSPSSSLRSLHSKAS
ncbi:hypothetical protein AB7M49_004021 [Bradyrhizobium elkanii]